MSSNKSSDLNIPTIKSKLDSSSKLKQQQSTSNDDTNVYDPQVANYLARGTTTTTNNNTNNNQFGNLIHTNIQHGNLNYSTSAAAAAAELQHRAELQRRQQQLQQQELQQQEQLQQYKQAKQREQQQAQQAQQQQQQQQQQHVQQAQQYHQLTQQYQQQYEQQQQQQQQIYHQQIVPPPAPQPQQSQQQQSQPQQSQQSQSYQQQTTTGSPTDVVVSNDDYNTSSSSGENLRSRYIENEIVKTFNSKPELVEFIRSELGPEERCKIVINSSKPKAVYFQCERSGSFRTTVKDSAKRQRIAYTKRNKCGFRLVANLYPNEKDSHNLGFDEDVVDDDDDDGESGEMWVLRMINPQHNHPPDSSNKKTRQKTSRTFVVGPINKPSHSSDGDLYNPHHHHHHHHHQPSYTVQSLDQPDVAVMAAIEASAVAAATGGDSSTSPNVNVTAAAVAALQQNNGTPGTNGGEEDEANIDPSVQAHDHSHGLRSRYM
ncbi:RBF1 Transcription factor RBF1 [Candida maltosa Xu316]